MSVLSVVWTGSVWEAECSEHGCWSLGKDPWYAFFLAFIHDRGHEEAAAVAEAVRIIQEGARA